MKNANQKANDILCRCSSSIGGIETSFFLDPKVTKISHDELLKKMYYALIECKFEFIIMAENFSNSFCENWNYDEIEFAKFKEILTEIMQKEVANPLKIDSDKIERDELAIEVDQVQVDAALKVMRDYISKIGTYKSKFAAVGSPEIHQFLEVYNSRYNDTTSAGYGDEKVHNMAVMEEVTATCDAYTGMLLCPSLDIVSL